MTISTQSLVDALRDRASREGERLALSYLKDGEDIVASWTYAELDRRARRIAAALQAIGSEGDRALLLFAPGLDFVAAFYGCLYARRIAVPVSAPHAARLEQSLPRLQAIAGSARPRALLTAAPLAGAAEALRASLPELSAMRVVAVDGLPEREEAWRDPGVRGETVAFLQYTSGSTASPKGVIVTHANLVANVSTIQSAYATGDHTTVVSWLPVYHDMGLIGCILHPVLIGASTYLMSPAAFLQKPLRWLQAVSRFQAYISGAPNFAYDYCVRRIRPEQCAGLDLRSWKVAFNGAEPVRASTLSAFARAFEPLGFAPAALSPCYGLAESTLFVSGRHPGETVPVVSFDAERLARGTALAGDGATASRALVGCGRAFAPGEVAVVDPERRTICDEGTVGEIWLRGPSVAQGYWSSPEETARTFRASTAGADGAPYLRTGDLGFLRSGELFITGRLKDLIIVDGRNHYPQDLEHTVEQCDPAFRPGCSAAFSIDDEGAERIVVVAEADAAADPASTGTRLHRSARSALASSHDLQLHALVLLKPGTVPKTTSGKIRRRACRDAYLSGGLDVWAGSPGA